MRLRFGLSLMLVALLARGAFAQQSKSRPFSSDLSISPWAREAVERLERERIIYGYPDGRYHGERPATRFENAIVLARFLDKAKQFGQVRSDGTVEFLLEQFAPAAMPATRDSSGYTYFRDVAPTWSVEYIRRMHEEGMLEGYPDGRFRRKQSLTRAELAVIVSRLILRTERKQPLTLGGNVFFKDVTGGEWSFGAILVAVGTGVMEGHPDRTFRGNQPVTRNELAIVLTRLKDLL